MISKELEEAIVKSLPAQTAGVLKTRLEKIDSLEKSEEALQKECFKLRKEIGDLEKQIKDQNRLAALAVTLETKERELEKRERDLDKTILSTQLQAEKDSTQKVYNLVDMVFRNKTTVRYETNQVPVFTPYAGGGGNHEMRTAFNHSEEKTELR